MINILFSTNKIESAFFYTQAKIPQYDNLSIVQSIIYKLRKIKTYFPMKQLIISDLGASANWNDGVVYLSRSHPHQHAWLKSKNPISCGLASGTQIEDVWYSALSLLRIKTQNLHDWGFRIFNFCFWIHLVV